MVRIERTKDDYFLFWKVLSGAGGYEPGKITLSESKTLDESQWNAFKEKLKQIDFWKLNKEDEQLGTDGSQWIMEGKSGSDYHLADRWSPDKKNAYYQTCDFLLGLSELKINGRKY